MPDIWDELITRIVTPQDRVLFEEAANAARSGALRTSYIAVWLSCAESFKRKFKDASQTDAAAAKIMGDINDKETKQQAVDAFVLAEAKKYGFISDAEFIQLENVYTQRCVYGHPYEQAPLPAQLHAAATIVVEYALSRPTKLRHGYLARQVDLICRDLTFLDDHYPAVDIYARFVHARSSGDLHLWFLQKLWKESAGLANDPSMGLFMRRVDWFSIAFLRQCDDAFFSAWDVAQNLTRYPFISSALATNDLFPKIGEHPQDIIVGNLLVAAKTQAVYLNTIEELHCTGKLTLRQTDRFLTTIQEIALNVIASSGLHPQFYVDRVIETLKSYNWYTQNSAIDIVKDIGPLGIGKLALAKQQELGNNVLQAADGNANGAVILLSELSRGDKEWPESFIEGIVAECFVNNENKFRFKTKLAIEALHCLRAVPADKRALIISRIVARLHGSSPKHQWSMENNRQQILKSIEEAIANDTPESAVLGALKDAVANLEIPKNE